MSKNIELKKEIVSSLKDEFINANSIIFVDYKGINVQQDTKLRRTFRENNVVYKVIKNRLITRALDAANITGYDPKMFEGTTAVAISNDEIAPAKVFVDAMGQIKSLSLKFGVVNGRILNAKEVEALSKIPSKNMLIAMLLGVLQGPTTALAIVLNEIAKQKQ